MRGRRFVGGELDTLAPRVPWDSFYSRMASAEDGFTQGDHVTILGPTKGGKTTLALSIVEIREYILGIFTKPQDPILSQVSSRGWRVSKNLDIKTQDGQVQDRRLAFWPVYTSGTVRERKERQAAAVRKALDYAFDAGGWCVFADETIWLVEHLRCKDELEQFWYQGRTNKNSLVALAQRPAWVPRAAYSQVEHVFFFHTADREDQKRFADLGGGVDVDAVRALVAGLERFEFLYVAPHERTLLRSSVDLNSAIRLRQPAAHELQPQSSS